MSISKYSRIRLRIITIKISIHSKVFNSIRFILLNINMRNGGRKLSIWMRNSPSISLYRKFRPSIRMAPSVIIISRNMIRAFWFLPIIKIFNPILLLNAKKDNTGWAYLKASWIAKINRGILSWCRQKKIWYYLRPISKCTRPLRIMMTSLNIKISIA